MPDSPLSAEILAEYAALTEGVGFVDVRHRTQIELRGSDRCAFLHGFCTNDVKRLKPGEGCEAFLTDVKGKILGYVFIFAGPRSLTLESVPGQAERILQHLDRYRISEDVQLADRSDEHAELLVAGAKAEAVLRDLLPTWPSLRPMTHVEGNWGETPFSLRSVPLTAAPSFLLACPSASYTAFHDTMLQYGAISCSDDALEIVRVEAGTPFYGRDVTDRNLPQEVGRDERTISFTKGCYLGQETVARLDAVGHVNRLLVMVRFDGGSGPHADAHLHVDGGKVGQVTSAVWSPLHSASLGLAYVRREYSSPGTKLESECGTATVLQQADH